MQYSTISYSSLEKSFLRLDSEYYHPKYIKLEKELNKYDTISISSFAKVTDGEHGSVELVSNGIKYLTAENIKKGYVEINSVRYVSKKVDERNKRARVNVGDILVSIKGTLGEIAIAEKSLLPANMNRDVAIIKPFNSILLPEYICLFLMSRLGNLQAIREGSGGVQQMITLGRLRSIKIPVLSDSFQKVLVSIFSSFLNYRNKSLHIYAQAEQVLLEELDLDEWQPKHKLSFVTNFSDIEEAERFDAEYFQPKYDELFGNITDNSEYIKTISEIQTYNSRGLQPKYSSDGTIDVITSKHILEAGLDFDNFEKTHSNNWDSQKKARIPQNSILTYTTGANIGRTALYPLEKKALASNHVNILTIENESPTYVAFVMNSIIGRMQTERLCAGSAQEELYPKDIEKFVIPFIKLSKQKAITKKIQESYNLREQLKHLLESAKTAVEMAIEKDEKSALKWLENVTKGQI